MAANNPSFSGAGKAASPDLLGKQYSFRSAWSTVAGFGLYENQFVRSEVIIQADRLFLDIRPRRLNRAPAILYEDMTGVTVSTYIGVWHILYFIVAGIAGLYLSPLFFLAAVVVLLSGIQKKITISQRNGVNVTIYEKSAAKAESFREDMKRLAAIM